MENIRQMMNGGLITQNCVWLTTVVLILFQETKEMYVFLSFLNINMQQVLQIRIRGKQVCVCSVWLIPLLLVSANVMTADALAPCAARAPTVMILAGLAWHIPASDQRGLIRFFFNLSNEKDSWNVLWWFHWQLLIHLLIFFISQGYFT